ncbi:hypothetical protein [Zeaxanthinibacter enoshimensis]|uniref:LTXXQ motif family protein n=1 Tax=Zeaxanthinibacter enoshimensis TaxID=392009 RepID=A0A4R6TNM0_9FLAO|nr:hypothetical protein [Zeaxanthinibacter enoshimensis]TDQ31359.1 hypothetical protein CLV82_2067 [Zeaxanthinibacter enoshimensis]
MKLQYLNFLLLGFLFLAPVDINAQDPYLQTENKTAEEIAIALTRDYQAELGMTVEQGSKFRQKVEEFQIRRQKIDKMDLPMPEKMVLMKKLSRQETAEIANILTNPQLRAYKRLKRSMQPEQVTIN